ncbi:rhomboid family intramembrane serine protease [Aquimarina rhabdastrellae]
MRGISDTVKHLLIINVLFWIGTLTIGQGGTIFTNLFAFHAPQNDMFKPWQVLTHMFMHASYVPTAGGSTVYFQHILFNMFALWMFGTPVEQQLGKKKFIFFYLSAGLGALFIHAGYNYFQFNSILNTLIESGYDKSQILALLNEGKYDTRWLSVINQDTLDTFVSNFLTVLVGASGAIMGVLVAFGMLFPNHKLMLIFLPIPIKAKYFIPAIILMDLFSVLTGVSIFSPSNTAYLAHLGGALFGFIMMWYWKKNSFNKHRWDR